MLRACVMEHQGSWDKNLPRAEFSYNNSYQECLKMALFEVLYGRRYHTSLNWIELGEMWSLDLTLLRRPKWPSVSFKTTWWPQSHNRVSYLVFIPKQSTHCMHDPGSIVPHKRLKVFTDTQMSWIKYNYYYINSVSKDWWLSVEQNSGTLHNTTGTTTEATHSLYFRVEEFQSILSFWAAGSSSKGKIARLSTLMVGTRQVQE
jgi:hypothetical protein